MQKFLNIKNIIALILIGIGLTLQLAPLIPNIKPKPDVAILNIDKPSDRVLALVQSTSDLITDPTDRAKVAIYSQEFANRVKSYDAQLQQVNDVLSLSAKEFFNGSINDKYIGLDDGIINLITSSVGGDDNHKLTDSEKAELSEVFMGLAWALIQRK
jgi:hypothetical protein